MSRHQTSYYPEETYSQSNFRSSTTFFYSDPSAPSKQSVSTPSATPSAVDIIKGCMPRFAFSSKTRLSIRANHCHFPSSARSPSHPQVVTPDVSMSSYLRHIPTNRCRSIFDRNNLWYTTGHGHITVVPSSTGSD